MPRQIRGMFKQHYGRFEQQVPFFCMCNHMSMSRDTTYEHVEK